MDLGRNEIVAVVGSRRRTDRAAVEACIAALPVGTTVISGGCWGVDTWAADAAVRRGLDVCVLLPNLAGVRCRGEAAGRMYARNQRVVDACDRVIAFPSADRTGGTEDTIRRATKAGKPVDLR
jgi:hypothetical protein